MAQHQDPELTTYDLKAVIIHRGGPYGGHYHAYIRDDLKEGVWNLQLPEKFEEQPVEVKPKDDKKKEEAGKEAETPKEADT